jgi:hypothetical protein
MPIAQNNRSWLKENEDHLSVPERRDLQLHLVW